MRVVNFKDLVGGLMLFAIGGFFAWFSQRYGYGTPQRMGAGVFPGALGLVAMAVGVALMAASTKPGEGFPPINPRAVIAVGLGVAVFAIVIGWFGLIPAVFLATAISAAGSRSSKPLSILAIAVCVTIGIWLIFSVGLRIPAPLWKGF